MKTPRQQIFLPLPPLSAPAAIELIDLLEAAVSELWCIYGDEIRELYLDDDDDASPDGEDIQSQ